MPKPSPDSADMLQMQHDLLQQLIALRENVLQEGNTIFDKWHLRISKERQKFVYSARNLAYYLALRRNDLRHLQEALRPLGLSSLGRIEGQVMETLNAVIATLATMVGDTRATIPSRPTVHDFAVGEHLLHTEARTVLGKSPHNRTVRMMVTLPSDASQNASLVQTMLEQGMDIARINCAHDTHADWAQMIAHVRTAEAQTGRACKVAMDLGGPKSRTAKIRQPKKTVLRKGDTLLLTYERPQKNKHYPIQAQCTLREALDQVQVGHSVWFDDGKIGTVVKARVVEGLLLEVTTASAEGHRLRADKGVNFPDTDLKLNPLTDQDLRDLDFIVHNADIVNYSFVQSVEDVQAIQDAISARHPTRPLALILKIETARAVRNLPELMIEAGGKQPFGVMIARGDLAVEVGFERMAELQEEIMWLCEAAQAPVIWATQVLETLAKFGIPSRAEITDAAMSERAECVMLNKGDYIVLAMQTLDSVLVRMEAHQSKKQQRLRALKTW